MTREEAIEFVKEAFIAWESEYRVPHEDWTETYKARDMAIEALQREDDLLKSLETNESLYDMVDVVRCKDCRYYECSGLPCPLDVCESLGDDGFCSCGGRKGGDDE